MQPFEAWHNPSTAAAAIQASEISGTHGHSFTHTVHVVTDISAIQNFHHVMLTMTLCP